MAEERNLDLFLGLLPFDVAVQCLARVPHACHAKSMVRVCRSWRTLVNSPFFYDLREQLGVSEPSAYTCVPSDSPEDSSMTWYGMNPVTKQWRRLPAMLDEHRPVVGFQTVTVEGSRLLVLGGSEMGADGRVKATGKVSQYCAIENRWTVLAGGMSVPRTNFACAVLQDRIYVRGGEAPERESGGAVELDFDWSAGDFMTDDVPDVLSSFEVKNFVLHDVPDVLSSFERKNFSGPEGEEETVEEVLEQSIEPEQLSPVEVFDPQTGKWAPFACVEDEKCLTSASALNAAFLAADFGTQMEIH